MSFSLSASEVHSEMSGALWANCRKSYRGSPVSIQDLCPWFSKEALEFAAGGAESPGELFKLHMWVLFPHPPRTLSSPLLAPPQHR